MLERSLQAEGIGLVTHNKYDLNSGQLPAFNGVDERLQITATAGNKYSDLQCYSLDS
jgi:hypothetical protein